MCRLQQRTVTPFPNTPQPKSKHRRTEAGPCNITEVKQDSIWSRKCFTAHQCQWQHSASCLSPTCTMGSIRACQKARGKWGERQSLDTIWEWVERGTWTWNPNISSSAVPHPEFCLLSCKPSETAVFWGFQNVPWNLTNLTCTIIYRRMCYKQ